MPLERSAHQAHTHKMDRVGLPEDGAAFARCASGERCKG